MKRFWSILCLALAISLCFGAVALATEAENEHTHVYANAYDSDKTKEPTCEEKGYAHRLCTICGEEDKDQPYIVVDPLGHFYDPFLVPDQFVEVLEEPTCTENGTAKCARMCANGCGTVLEYYNTSDPDAVDAMEGSTSIRALGHDWGEEEEVEGTRKDPTCVENGSYEVHIVCQRCGVEKPDSRRTVNDIKEDEEIEATGHEEADPVQENVKEATCMTPEEYDEVVYCSKCHIELSRKHVVGVSNPNNHVPAEPVMENFVDSTCVDNGSYDMVVYCSLCKSELSRTTYEITLLKPHTWVEDLDNPNNVKPTCYSTGLKHEYCSVCGAKNEPVVLPRKEHTYGPVIEVPATCMTTGGKLQECTVKGCTADVEGHFNYIEVYPINPDNHKWILAEEDATATPDNPYDSVTRMPTCTQHGVYAYYCEYNNTHRYAEQIEPLGHDVITLNAIAPTCTEVGYTEGEVCVREGCDGKAKKLPAGYPTEQLDEITAEYGQYLVTKAPKEIPANGHTKLDILEQYTYCTAQQADADDNNPNKGNGVGYIKYKCAVCGEEVEEEVEPTGHDWVRMESDDMSATCINGGYASFRCAKCGEEKQELIPATGEHQWGEEIYIAPTCKTAGRLDRICEVCGFVDHLEFYDIDEKAHHFEIDWNNITKWPSCTEEGFGAYVCTECGFVKYEAIPVNEHEWDEGTVTKAATCTEEGEMTYTCIGCETTKTEPIEKIPHTEEVIPGKPATADEPGLTDGIKCSVCGEILKEQEEISPLCKDGHKLMAPVVTKEATCTDAGEKSYTCFVCGNVIETEEIPATGHSFDEGTVTKEATCTEAGEKTYKCTVCGEVVKTEEIAALGHKSDEGTVTKEATCTEAGEKTYKCTVCGEVVKTEEIEKIPHTEEIIPGKAPTSTEDGLTEGKKCSVCGEILVPQETISHLCPEGHSWLVGVVTKEATCTEAGEMTYKCAVCGDTKTEEIAALGHKSDEGTVTKEATCTEAGEKTYKCTVCGEVIKTEEIAALGHKSDEGTVTKEATCTEAGEKTYKCTVCGEVLKTEEIAALGHKSDEGIVTKEATCTEAGEKTYKCTVCGEVVKTEEIAALGHKADEGTVTKAATCTELGEKTYKCTVCGEVLSTEAIEKIPHTEEVIPGVEPTETETGLTEGIKCSVCGEILKAQEVIPAKGIAKNGLVLDDDGEWRYYVDGEFAKDVTGIVEFEGGSFFVAEGVLCKDANGLQMYPEGTWYFLANGQVQKQYTGLALYDGEWFYIVNGRLDKSLYGLVEFQGGQFLVNEGMILSSANGLWMDKDGTWYYLEKGQVAFWFNGAVKYQGGTFKVVNGIVK